MTEQDRLVISLLLRAKAAGDTRTWARKAELSRRALRSAPGDFYRDSREKHIAGLTHKPSGFRFHLPKDQIQSLNIQQGEDMTSKDMTSLKAGAFSVYKQAGLPKPLWEPMLAKAVKEAQTNGAAKDYSKPAVIDRTKPVPKVDPNASAIDKYTPGTPAYSNAVKRSWRPGPASTNAVVKAK